MIVTVIARVIVGIVIVIVRVTATVIKLPYLLGPYMFMAALPHLRQCSCYVFCISPGKAYVVLLPDGRHRGVNGSDS